MNLIQSNKSKYIALIILSITSIVLFYYNPLTYEYQPSNPPETFEKFYRTKLEQSKQEGVRKDNEEYFKRRNPERSEYTILFIHGFGASRKEGEFLVDRLSHKLKANVYYLRLAGHGTNKEDQAALTWTDYLDSAEEAFAMMHKIGHKIILVGSSTGGSLATWLASRYPKQVYGLVLASPFYDFADPMAGILNYPGGLTIAKLVEGSDRDASNNSKRVVKGYNNYWLIDQKVEALGALSKLRRFIDRESVYRRVTSPTLLFYYYKDESHKDSTVSIEAMKLAFTKFGTIRSPKNIIKPHPLNRMIPVADGNHILLSEFVKTDKKFIEHELGVFFTSIEKYNKKKEKINGALSDSEVMNSMMNVHTAH